MKTNIILLFIFLLVLPNWGCQNRPKKNTGSQIENPVDTTTVADTGFTGIRRYFSKGTLVKEVTLKNGVREGLMKTNYQGGQLNQTFWYENGVRQDTARSYYIDGKLFRTTLFKNDTANGIQTQYYKSGAVMAKLNYVNGLRTPYLEEFESNGKKITGYPDMVIRTKDEYAQNGIFKIYVELTKKDTEANFYRGEYINGLFNPNKCTIINISKTTGYIALRKSANQGNNFVGVIAAILTTGGNRYLVYKKIDLPYNDLK
jgi:hypothetical protein